MTKQKKTESWHKEWWGIILIITFFPIVVPYLVWTKTTWAKWIKITITVFCVIFVIYSINDSNKRRKEALALVDQAETFISKDEIDDALDVLSKSQELNTTKNENTAFELEEKIIKLQSSEFLKKTLVNMSNSDFSLLQKSKLKKTFIKHDGLNKLFIAKLQENAEQRTVYINEVEKLKKEEEAKKEKLKKEEEAKKEEEREKEKEKKKRKEKEAKETLSEKNAIRKAKSYLSMSGFSRDGLIKQLKFEGFSHEDAVYATDDIDVDWNKQAEKKAKSYLNMSGFSRDGLIKQLKFEGFTNEQAVHGVDAIGL